MTLAPSAGAALDRRPISLPLLVTLALGCGLEPEPCGGDGCCPAWTRDSAGACAPRRWATIAELDGGASAPQVAVAPDGWVSAVWLGTAEIGADLRAASELDGFAIERAAAMGAASDPQLGARSGGRVVVAWREASASTAIRVGRREPSGRWRFEAEPLSYPPDAYDPDVAIAADETIVAWNQRSGDHWGVALARAEGDGALVRPPHVYDVLSPPVYFSNNPDVALHPSGEGLVSWYQATNDYLMTFVSERRPGARHFSHPRPDEVLSPLGSDVEEPVVALSPLREAAVAWWQRTSDGRMAVHLAVRAPDGAWAEPQEAFSQPSEVVSHVRVAFAGDGDLYVLWRFADADRYGVHLAHRSAAGEWLAPGRAPLLLSAPERRGYDPSLAAGRRGVVAAWTEKEGEHTQVVTRRSAIDATGAEAARWGSPTILSGEGGGESALAIGGDDRAACAWTEAGRLFLATID